MDNNIIRKLYRDMLKEGTDTDKISGETKKEIEALLLDITDGKESQEYEKYRDEFLLAASAAEENGFVKGFKYAFRLFTECASE